MKRSESLRDEARDMKQRWEPFAFILLYACLGLLSPDSTLAGPRYEFPSHNSPGVELELKEDSREKSGEFTIVYYHLYAKGLAPGKKLSIYQWIWDLDDGILAQAGYEVDPTGEVLCSELPAEGASSEATDRWCRGNLDEAHLVAVGFQEGQVFRVALISTDAEEKGFVEAIPFPIETEEDGCRLEAERQSEEADAWMILGEGFKPGDVVHWVLKIPGQNKAGESTIPETGRLAFRLNPATSGERKGKVKVKVDATGCHPSLSFKWGESAMEYP